MKSKSGMCSKTVLSQQEFLDFDSLWGLEKSVSKGLTHMQFAVTIQETNVGDKSEIKKADTVNLKPKGPR